MIFWRVLIATITYRTTDEKRDQLAILAQEQNTSVNKLIDELVTITLAERNAYLHFSTRARRGDPAKALDVLKAKAM